MLEFVSFVKTSFSFTSKSPRGGVVAENATVMTVKKNKKQDYPQHLNQ